MGERWHAGLARIGFATTGLEVEEVHEHSALDIRGHLLRWSARFKDIAKDDMNCP